MPDVSGEGQLPEIDAKVEELERRTRESAALFVLEGSATAGKSTVLRRFAARARNDRPVIELHLPRTPRGELADDAGPFALAMAAEQLRHHEDGGGAWDRLRAKAQWSEVLDALGDSLDTLKPLIVIDDVPSDRGDATFGSYFRDLADQVVDTLLARPTLRVVTTDRAGSLLGAARVRMTAWSNPGDVLDPSRWNGLGAAARALKSSPFDDVTALSPLELRLAVGLVAAGTDPGEALHLRLREKIRRLLDANDALRRIVGTLSLVRGSFDADLLDRLGVSSLDSNTRKILEGAILFREADDFTLHEVFAGESEVAGWLTRDAERAGHETLFAYYRDQLLRADEERPATALRAELDAFHHLTALGDVSRLAQVKLYFAEQLNALGKQLSLQRRHAEAVSVYERALVRAPDDWYAHHYLAYNLDAQGTDAPRVETEYREALKRRPENVWCHGRLACFYVTRGRSRDAKKVFDRALRDLESQHATEERFYRELHGWLARLLLHRGQLDFAREVLDGAPPSIRGAEWWGPLDRLWMRLDEAEREASVTPRGGIPERPTLVRDDDQARVASWMPARLTRVDERGASFRISQEGELGWLDLTNQELDAQWKGPKPARAAGTYVEIITWTDDVQEILVHYPQPDPALLPLGLAPNRYIRHMSAPSGHS